jgi:hypothetical protein
MLNGYSTMKIYCLLLDAFPYAPEIDKFTEDNGLSFLLQISHSHTCPTMFSMLMGENPLDRMPRGYGFDGYLDSDNFCKCRNDPSVSLIDILKREQFIFHNNNRIGFCCRDFLALSCCGISMPPGIEALKSGDYYIDQVQNIDRYNHVRLTESNPESNDSFSGFGNPELCKQWYDNEVVKIKDIRKSSDNILYVHQSHHWGATHEVGWTQPTVSREHAIKHTLSWLENWDFNEPDTIFWIFSDHGITSSPDINPNSYLSWVLVKDNTADPMNINRSIIHPTDFYATVLKKITGCPGSGRGLALDENIDLNRVYYSEDARKFVNPYYTTSSSKIKVNSISEDGLPDSMMQATYFKPNQSLKLLEYQFKKKDLANNHNMIGKIYKNIDTKVSDMCEETRQFIREDFSEFV